MLLKIYLLGQFKLQSGDIPIDLPSRPAQAVMAYLALNPGVSIRREALASLLWPDAAESNARSYLRQALWRIRKSLESGSLIWEDYLQISDISVLFDDRSDGWVDANKMLEPIQEIAESEIEQVVNLYRGELLPGFYEDWVVLERERIQAAYHQKMNLLLERLVQTRRWDQAMDYAEQWIQLGHTPEPAYRALMHAYAGQGDLGMVSATYQRCLEALHRELGLEPSSETMILYEQIILGDTDTLDTRSISFIDTTVQPPPFLDQETPQQIEAPYFAARRLELDKLEKFLNLAIVDKGRVVFVIGEAGSGKTALLEEFSRQSQEKYPGLVVASGNCNAHTGIGDPYLPFREVMELLTGNVESRWSAGAITTEHARRLWNTLPITAQALVESGPDLVGTFVSSGALLQRVGGCFPCGTGWLSQLQVLAERQAARTTLISSLQSDLFDQYARVLASVAREFPMLIMLDDLQWADQGSIGLLFHLGRFLAGSRIMLTGVYRPEEVAIGREGERHPLEPVIHEIQRHYGDININLDKSESMEFIQDILASEPNRLESDFKDMLHNQTQGHPLFTIELLRGMQERGDLQRDRDGFWVEGSSLDWETLPARVEAVIAERIARLPQPLRATLRTASVEGEVFTAEVVARVQKTAGDQILGNLSRTLDKKHHLIQTQSVARVNNQLLSRYRFRNILIQKYLYNSLDEVERVHLHQRVGDTLEDLFLVNGQIAADTGIAPQLARHFQESWNYEKAIHYLHLSGNMAVQLSAYQEARTHFYRAMELLKSLPENPERDELELALQTANMIAWKGYPGTEWENSCIRALELSRKMGKIQPRCLVLSDLAIIYYVRAQYQRAMQYIEEAVQVAQQAEDQLLLILGYWISGVLHFGMGEYSRAKFYLENVFNFYVPEEHHQVSVQLLGVDGCLSGMAYLACNLWCLGYPEQAQELSNKTLELAHELNHPFTLADVLSHAGCLFYEMLGDASTVEKYAAELERLSQRKVLAWTGAGTRHLGAALSQLGQIGKGIVLMQEGMEVCRSLDIFCNFPGTLRFLAEARVINGQAEQALNTIDEALKIVEETDEHNWESELYRLRAELLLSKGDETGAEASLLESIQVAQRQNAKSWELRACIDLARLWQTQGKANEAARMLGEIYSWFTEGFDTPDLQEANSLLEDLS